MTNKEVAAVLNEIATLLDLAGESPFKGRAYTNVARQIEQLEEDVADLASEKRLREIKGVGDALEKKITELVESGALQYHLELRNQFPDTLFELFSISGLGPKRIKALYDTLQIASLDRLETACRNNELTSLKGFGPKMIEKILEGIDFARRHQGQFHFDVASRQAQRLIDDLKASKAVKRISVAGSLRRRKEVVKDIDIIVSSPDPKKVMKRFVEHEDVERITGHGDTKSSVVLSSGIAADLRVVSDEQFPYALAHFTGSKEHNVHMRQRAKERNLKLNEYGLFNGDEILPCMEEADIHAKLGLPFIPPEMREDMGEFDIEKTPSLVTMEDILGVIHCHTTYSDGQNTLEQMVAAAKQKGYQYITITDHSQTASYAGGLKIEHILDQHRAIDLLNALDADFRVLKGIESDILADGSLDYEESVLKRFDLIIASVHSNLNMTEKEATKRIIKAIENPYTTILGHPTGRLLLSRQGFPLNFDKVFEACVANNVAVEINANCRRLDLDWRYVHRAKDKGVKLSIGPDAHNVEGLDNIPYGLGIARKGWLEPSDLLNCMTADEFAAWHG